MGSTSSDAVYTHADINIITSVMLVTLNNASDYWTNGPTG